MLNNLPTPTVNLLDELRSQRPKDVPKLHLEEISMERLMEIIQKVKRTPASGADGISGIILLDIIDKIKVPLLHLVNLSQWSGIFPEVLKMTKIIPVVKAGKDPNLAGSYRPVSNLSLIGKIVERAVMEQFEKHVTTNHLWSKDHHGGRPGHSTTTCVGELLEDVHQAKKDKLQVALVALDLSAAYDMVNHAILLEQCRLMNIGSLENWLRSFLGARSQLIDLEGTWSQPILTGSLGVVQGGPSSGFLFNLYINNLPSQVNGGQLATTTIHTTEKQFVDDGTLVVRGNSLTELKCNITKEYLVVRNFLINHRLVINDSKTQLMFVNPDKKEELLVCLGSTTIQHQPAVKILGLTINEDLRWDEHLWKGNNSMLRNIKIKSSLVRTLRPFVSRKLLGLVGGSLINSTILYGAPLWGATSAKNKQIIQVAQTRAARSITLSWNRVGTIYHRQEILNKINWPNVEQMIVSSTLNLLKKAISRRSSSGLNNLFKIKFPNSKTRNRCLRIDHRGTGSNSRKTFSSNAPVLFNELPGLLKDPKLTIRQFKSKLKSHLKCSKLLSET